MTLAVSKAVFDVHYADGRTSLVMEADMDRGWKKLTSTYGFSQQLRIPYRDDLWAVHLCEAWRFFPDCQKATYVPHTLEA